MRRTKRAIVVVVFTLVSCSSRALPVATPTSQVTALRLYATTSTLPLVNDLTSAYSRLNPSISFEIASGNYDAMMDHLLSGETPFFLTNHLPPEEATPVVAFPVGQDAIAVIVHPENEVSGLTTEQVRDIYQGWSSNWSEYGGADVPITLFSREDGSGTRAEFESLVMGDRRIARTAQIAPSSRAGVTAVAREPGGISYVSMSFLDDRVRALSIDGVLPTPENVINNSYPLRSFLYIAGLREPDGSEPDDIDYRAFIGWVQSAEGQAVVARRYAPLPQ
jgi:phosphate transport system substrate-binding protein